MSESLWLVDEEKTKDHWLEVVDPEGWAHAVVKWDGCINYTRYFNLPLSEDENDSDCIHICDINDMIERLQALKTAALKHFGEHWPPA